jgi:hypothetical protein
MLQFDNFSFAAPPRCATSWFLSAAFEAGLGEYRKSKVFAPWKYGESPSALKLTFVRDPYDWLVSYHTNIYPGSVGVPEVDVFRVMNGGFRLDLSQFLDHYFTHLQGKITEMFAAYKADSVVRIEDLPAGLWSIFEMLGVDEVAKKKIFALPRVNTTQVDLKPSIRKSVRLNVLEAEFAFCERYGYI